MDNTNKKPKRKKPSLFFKVYYMGKGGVLTAFCMMVLIMSHQVHRNGLEWLTARIDNDAAVQNVNVAMQQDTLTDMLGHSLPQRPQHRR